jgi:hypothetical protein
MARQLQSYYALPADPKGVALSALAKKLRLKPDDIVAVLNAPPGYLEYLAPGPSTIVTELKPDHQYDAVQVFVDDVEQLRAISGAAIAAVKPEGLLWVTHRKGKWKNDALSEIFSASGYTPVSFVKVDETWTAVRLKKG